MTVFRVNKSKDYITMSKTHLKEKNMSLKAKGLLSEMLGLPDEWNYSIGGLVAINKENESAIKSTLSELKDFGYLKITKLMPNITTTGRIEYIYDIYEYPIQEVEKQEVENLPLEIQPLEIHTQLINKEINNNNEITNNKKENNKKKKYGEYENVLLTDKEYEKLSNDYPNVKELIKFLDEYIEEKGYKSKSHNLSIRRWVVNAVKEKNIKGKDAKQFDRPAWLDMDL